MTRDGEGAGERVPLRDACVCAAGLAVSVALYGLAVWAPAGMFAGISELPSASVLSAVSSVVHALGLLAFGLAGTFVWRQGALRAGVSGLALLAAALWACAYVAGGTCPAWLALACGVLSGLAVAAGFACWVGALSRLPERTRRGALACAACLAAVLSLLAVAPLAARRASVIALLAAQAVLAWRSVGAPVDVPGQVAPGRAGSGRGARVLATLLAPVVVAAVVVSFAAPLVNGVLMLDALPMASRAVISACMGLACGAALGAAWLLPRRVPSVLTLLLGFTVLLFGAFVLNWLADLHLSLLVLALGSAGYFLVLYVLMEACVEASAAARVPAHLAYGAAGCVVMLARVAADDVSLRLLHAGVTEETKTLVAMFLMVYLLTCAGFALYHALTRPRRSEPAPAPRAEAPSAGAPDAPRAAAVDETTLRCEAVGERCGLSPRELQVLVLMMHGRNVPAIAEELSISRNTVQTHVRHIYEALDVHGRQELVAYVESAPRA